MRDDSINRQAAVDAVLGVIPYDEYWLEQVNKAIEALPPADTVEVVRCKDCRHNHNCDIQYHAQAGDLFFCGAAERKDGDGNG